MNKINKPKFFTTPIWGNISIILGIILAFSFSNKLSDIQLLVIILGLILTFLIWNLVKYIINWHNLYDNYIDFYDKLNELENRYNIRIDEIKNKDLLIKEYENFIANLNIFIITSLTNNSAAETEQLKNMQSYLYLSVEHLNKLKGGNNSGRDL